MADPTFPDAALTPSGAQPAAFIMHHTAGRGDPASVVNFWKQQGRGYGAQYIMDRNGVIHDTQKEFGYSGSNEILNDPSHKLSNGNVVGMEIVANNDADVTPQQAQAAAAFVQARYPNTPVFGHGQVNPGHKEATEGFTAVNAVDALRGGTPLVDARVAATANTASLSPPSRPTTTTPGVTLNSTPMDLVANVESGNRNIPQAIHDKNTDKGTPAGGYWQIIDPTWQRYAGAAGVDVKQYPNAMSAPRNIQAQVAGFIPVNQWGPNTVAALKAKYPNIDTSQTLGQVQSAALGSAPATPGTSIAGISPDQSKALMGDLSQLDKSMGGKGLGGAGGTAGDEPQPQPMGPAPPIHNMSNPAAFAPALWGNTLNSIQAPAQWSSQAPGQNPYAAAGGQPLGQQFGTQLGSLQQMQQMMAMMGSPYGDAGYG